MGLTFLKLRRKMNINIGIVPAYEADKGSYVEQTYIDAVERSGGAAVILPFPFDEVTDSDLEKCDGFLFCGGADISPEIYGEKISELCGKIEPKRDIYELAMLRVILDTGKPILAICRGMQLINAALGGTLYQDLSSQHPTEVTHRCVNAKYDVEHAARLIEGTPLYDLIGKERITVNSYHHQAIKTLAVGLRASAVADDGIIEAVYHTERRLSGFQWHPERMLDKENRLILEDFIKECTRR